MTALEGVFIVGAGVALVSVVLLLALIHLAEAVDNERPQE